MLRAGQTHTVTYVPGSQSLPLSISNSISASEGPPARPVKTHVPLCFFDWFFSGFLVFWNSGIHIHADFAHKCPLPKFICEAHTNRIWSHVFFPQTVYPSRAFRKHSSIKIIRKTQGRMQKIISAFKNNNDNKTTPNSVRSSRSSTDSLFLGLLTKTVIICD